MPYPPHPDDHDQVVMTVSEDPSTETSHDLADSTADELLEEQSEFSRRRAFLAEEQYELYL